MMLMMGHLIVLLWNWLALIGRRMAWTVLPLDLVFSRLGLVFLQSHWMGVRWSSVFGFPSCIFGKIRHVSRSLENRT